MIYTKLSTLERKIKNLKVRKFEKMRSLLIGIMCIAFIVIASGKKIDINVFV